MESWKRGSTIGVYCTKNLENNPAILDSCPVVIVDEFHTIHNKVFLEALSRHSAQGAIVLQFSATPPENPLGELICSYSQEEARKDKVNAPTIYYDLDVNFTDEDSIQAFIEDLPSFLKTHPHPHGGILDEN